jgi:hypothetical protein
VLGRIPTVVQAGTKPTLLALRRKAATYFALAAIASYIPFGVVTGGPNANANVLVMFGLAGVCFAVAAYASGYGLCRAFFLSTSRRRALVAAALATIAVATFALLLAAVAFGVLYGMILLPIATNRPINVRIGGALQFGFFACSMFVALSWPLIVAAFATASWQLLRARG